MINPKHLKQVPYNTPLFKTSFKAYPNTSPNNTKYIVIQNNPSIYQKSILQSNYICPIIQYFQKEHSQTIKTYILVEGQNFQKIYKSKWNNKAMAQEEIWAFISDISNAMIDILTIQGIQHPHLKQYAIRQIGKCEESIQNNLNLKYQSQSHYQHSFKCKKYKLIYHKQMIKINEIVSAKNWNNFYLSPQQITCFDNDNKEKQQNNLRKNHTVFSLGLMVLNQMNPLDHNRTIYSKSQFLIDNKMIQEKLQYARHRYSKYLINIIEKCLLFNPLNRYTITQFSAVIVETLAKISTQKQKYLKNIVKMNQSKNIEAINIKKKKTQYSKKKSSNINCKQQNDKKMNDQNNQKYEEDQPKGTTLPVKKGSQIINKNNKEELNMLSNQGELNQQCVKIQFLKNDLTNQKTQFKIIQYPQNLQIETHYGRQKQPITKLIQQQNTKQLQLNKIALQSQKSSKIIQNQSNQIIDQKAKIINSELFTTKRKMYQENLSLFKKYRESTSHPNPNHNLKLINLEYCLSPLNILKLQFKTPYIKIGQDLYYGQLKGGRRTGFGLQIFPNQQYYYGQFVNDLFHGQGFYYWNSNQYFLGKFSDGQRAYGYYKAQRFQYQGSFKNGKRNGNGVCWYKDQRTYHGNYLNGKKQGEGYLVEESGLYIGKFEKNKKCGWGMYCVGNSIIYGNWDDEEIIGQGEIIYENGDYFKGKLKGQQLKRYGYGQHHFKSGAVFKGTFDGNSPCHGQFIYQNGERYVGCIRNFKRHGYGTYFYNNNTIYKGSWHNGEKIINQVIQNNQPLT